MVPEVANCLCWFTFSCFLPVIVNGICKLTTCSLYYNVPVAVSLLVMIILFFTINNSFSRKVALCSSFLGFTFAVGLLIAVSFPQKWSIFGWYICFLTFFHFSEFLTIALANSASLSIDSFMLNHSYAYGVALVASWLEYFVEIYFVPDLKITRTISALGFIMCIFGEAVRKMAMITASSNFHHIVQTTKKNHHRLVTHRIYRICRHPGYVGWFFWAMGTQLILVNPLCFVAYTISSWIFFRDRILFEEMTLINFFGNEYLKYKKCVVSGLPFIHGYKISD